jgi:hypothetical protein
LSRCKSQELRAKGDGILKFGKKLGIGTSVVQRVFKQEQVSLIGQKGLCRSIRSEAVCALSSAWPGSSPFQRPASQIAKPIIERAYHKAAD